MTTAKIERNGKFGKAGVLAFGALTFSLALWFAPADAWAQLPTDRVDDIFGELQELAKKVAWGILGIGVIVIGVKLSNGDPDTKQRAWQFLFAGLVVYMAGDVLEWLQN